MLNPKCPFCTPQIESRVIYENSSARLILSRDAINPGQALVLSKKHVATLLELNDNEFIEMYLLAKKVAEIFMKKFSYDGVNLLLNSGIAAGQTVHHSHIHIVPRIAGDVPIAREWLNPVLQQKEYKPDRAESLRYSKAIKDELEKS